MCLQKEKLITCLLPQEWTIRGIASQQLEALQLSGWEWPTRIFLDSPLLWEPSTYTWLEKCEFLFCKEPGDLAKANILESICVKRSEILEYSIRESNGGSLWETLQPRKGIWIFSRITLKQRNGQEQTIWILEKFKTTELLSRLCASQAVLGVLFTAIFSVTLYHWLCKMK